MKGRGKAGRVRRIGSVALLALGAALALGMAGCAASPAPEAQSASEPGVHSPSAQPAAEPVWPDSLVVYYSATGTTERVAAMVAQATGAHTFAVEPAEPYTSADLAYDDAESRVSREHDDPSLRDGALVSATVPGWDSYGVVFVGYPIWWGEAAWPMASFVAANDFAGKRVVPFCTSGGSGIGTSGQALAQQAGTGEWLEGMRFPASATQADVDEWVASLNLWAD